MAPTTRQTTGTIQSSLANSDTPSFKSELLRTKPGSVKDLKTAKDLLSKKFSPNHDFETHSNAALSLALL
jgi:hypothetical protein